MCNKVFAMCMTVGLMASVTLADPELPVFNPANFTPNAPIDNNYLPRVPGTIYTYGAEIEDGGDTIEIRIEEFVTFKRKMVAGVPSVVVRAREWEDGLLVEDTDDWYAQDNDGNVWYMGEFSTEFEYDDDDNLIGTDHGGSWKTGKNGAQPGFIMKTNPQVGDNYYQEFAPNDDAVDQATILSLTEMVSIDYGDFNNVLVALEFNELEPGAFDNKLYAPGVGLVLEEEGVDEFGNDPENLIPLLSIETIPEPATGCLLMAGLLTLMRRGPMQVARGRKRV